MTFFVPVPRQARVLAGGLFACSCCRVQLFATLWTVAHQVPLSMGFVRQEYWSGLPFPLDGAVTVMSLQSCPTLCDPIDGSPQGSPVPGILQARTLEWVAISFSNAGSESEVAQLCPSLRDPMDCSPPGSSAHGIFQARALEWGAIPLGWRGAV